MRKQIADFIPRTDHYAGQDDIEVLKAWQDECSRILAEAKDCFLGEEEISELDLRRKRLHNSIESLKGSIRVFVRIRPFSKRESDNGDKQVRIH